MDSALDVIPWKRPFTYYGTAPGQRRPGPNPQAFYPWLSSTCLYKNGFVAMNLGMQLFCPISCRGEFIFLSFARIYG